MKDVPLNGIGCPACPKEALTRVKTFTEFKRHLKEVHGASDNLRKSSSVKYSCHKDGCRTKSVAYETFTGHNRDKHSWNYFCVDCDEPVARSDSKGHQEEYPEHILRAPWEFSALIWSTKDTR